MRYGTPRNTLSTAPYPLEIVQRPERLTMIFDRLGDVRRVFLDGRARPNPLWPTWLGHSLGHWEGETLVIETVAMTQEWHPSLHITRPRTTSPTRPPR